MERGNKSDPCPAPQSKTKQQNKIELPTQRTLSALPGVFLSAGPARVLFLSLQSYFVAATCERFPACSSYLNFLLWGKYLSPFL